MTRGAQGDLIWGIHAVEEALSLPESLQECLVDAGAGKGARAVARKAEALGVACRVLPSQAFRELARGRPFQGVAARVAPFKYADPDELIVSVVSERGVVLALDQVQDPQNLGSVLRTAAFFGVKGVFLPKDRSAPVSPAVVRASAGGAFRVPVARVVNMARLVRGGRDAGLFAIAAVAQGGKDVRDIRLPDAGVLLVMGSEAEGVRRLVRESCDALVTIPSPGGFESLNVGVATGILLHVLTRQAP